MQYSEAEKEFEKAIKLNPKLYETYYFYARTCKQQGQIKKAVKLFEKASEVRSEDYQAKLFAASAYRDLKLYNKANEANQQGILLAEKYLELNPGDARALYLGAIALTEISKTDKAIEWCNRAIAIDPNDISVLYNVTCVYSLLGKIDQALEYFEKTIDSGYASKEWIKADSDFDPIRNHPRFKVILNKMK